MNYRFFLYFALSIIAGICSTVLLSVFFNPDLSSHFHTAIFATPGILVSTLSLYLFQAKALRQDSKLFQEATKNAFTFRLGNKLPGSYFYQDIEQFNASIVEEINKFKDTTRGVVKVGDNIAIGAAEVSYFLDKNGNSVLDGDESLIPTGEKYMQISPLPIHVGNERQFHERYVVEPGRYRFIDVHENLAMSNPMSNFSKAILISSKSWTFSPIVLI